MTGVADSKDPLKKWKMDILQEEINCHRDFLMRCGSHDEEGYIVMKEIMTDLERWLDDLKNNSTDTLSEDDLDWRYSVIDNQITIHHDILMEDHMLTAEDRRIIGKIIEDLEEWKRDFRK